MLLLAMGLGTILALPTAGLVVRQTGAGPAVAGCATIAGAGLGWAAAAAEVPVAVHLGTVAVLATVLMAMASRWLLPAGDDQPAGGPPDVLLWLRTAWREPRTVLIGVPVLTFALGEGIASGWLAVAVVDGIGVSHAGGAATFAVFVVAMTGARIVGTAAIDRFRPRPGVAGQRRTGECRCGRVPRAAVRVSVVASISYPVFLAGRRCWARSATSSAYSGHCWWWQRRAWWSPGLPGHLRRYRSSVS